MKGKFVVIDGLDKTGKTTLINNLRKVYSDTVFVCDPSKKVNLIRNAILNTPDLQIKTRAALYTAARKELVDKEILPALEDGKNIICDRYWGSTYAYQCVSEQNSTKEWIKASVFIDHLHRIMGINLNPDGEIIMLNTKPLSNKNDPQDVMDKYCIENRRKITDNYVRYYYKKAYRYPIYQLWVDGLDEQTVLKEACKFIENIYDEYGINRAASY